MVAYVLDTNIVSEPMKPKPNHEAICWLQDFADESYLTTVTLMELYYGVMRLPDGKRKRVLTEALQAIANDCKDRILEFDSFSAFLCAEMRSKAQSAGVTPQMSDCMIAAICKRHDAVLVTHNGKDFEFFDIEVFDPFEYESEMLKELRRREAAFAN